MIDLLKIPSDISMVYCYTVIPDVGKESITLVNRAIQILNNAHIELPPIDAVKFSAFSEKMVGVKNFDGTKLSIIL